MVEISEVHEFQSTLPLRGVTGAGSPPIRIRFISIHTPLAGSDWSDVCTKILPISIHTPLAGSDADALHLGLGEVISIHTPLAGSDGEQILVVDSLPKISIHTPLAGSDSAASACSKWIGYFNPHSPCGE